ncbi:MAG: putative metal-binding motif-containing protein, partial [Myxococcales bacterium]|nr:putative metal-binding motif-containing protein [Myxococcales bacterium]
MHVREWTGRSAPSWGRVLLCCAVLAGAVGCDDGGSEAGASVRVVAAGVERIDRLTVVIKREGAGDAGATARQVQETSFAVSGDQVVGKPFRLREAWIPEGAGEVFVHAIAYADDAIVGIGDGRAGDGTGSHLITIRPYDAACDLDGDTYLDCGNLRAGCCQSLEARDHAAFEDCHDDPAAVGGGADLKTRDAKLASPFAPTEDATDYAFCQNGLDEDCANGDVACADVDADQDGFTVATDCDDADPAINPEAYDAPGDGVDQNCDGAEGTGTDADGDGFFGDDPDPARRDCDDGNRFVNPGAPEVPCNTIDDDCRGGDACAMGDDLDGDGVSPPEDCDDMDAGRRPGAREQCGDGIDQDCDGSDLACPEGDLDGDGFAGDDDCDETDKLVHRGAPERCDDGVDQDCDGADRPCPPDGDADGDGWVVPDDCDDDDNTIRPGADEICDAVDQDCDGTVDE